MSAFSFFSFAPRAELRPFVHCIWGVRGGGGHRAEAVLPSGAVELMVNFGPPQRLVARGERRLTSTYRVAWLAGIQDRPLAHSGEPACDHLSVSFRTGAAHAFFDLPADETANRVVELEQLIGAEAIRLRDRLGATASDRARATEIEEWLLARCRPASVFSDVRRALGLLDTQRAPVGEACERLGLSNKSLIAQFRRTVGLTPKLVARIHRFQRVVATCRHRESVSWRDLAYELGFADQAHLVREVRRFAGITPATYLRVRTPEGGQLVVDSP